MEVTEDGEPENDEVLEPEKHVLESGSDADANHDHVRHEGQPENADDDRGALARHGSGVEVERPDTRQPEGVEELQCRLARLRRREGKEDEACRDLHKTAKKPKLRIYEFAYPAVGGAAVGIDAVQVVVSNRHAHDRQKPNPDGSR